MSGYPLNTAQTLVLHYFDPHIERFGRNYKAPHAYRGTPARPRIDRKVRFATAFDDDGRVVAYKRPRLFKGHRA